MESLLGRPTAALQVPGQCHLELRTARTLSEAQQAAGWMAPVAPEPPGPAMVRGKAWWHQPRRQPRPRMCGGSPACWRRSGWKGKGSLLAWFLSRHPEASRRHDVGRGVGAAAAALHPLLGRLHSDPPDLACLSPRTFSANGSAALVQSVSLGVRKGLLALLGVKRAGQWWMSAAETTATVSTRRTARIV